MNLQASWLPVPDHVVANMSLIPNAIFHGSPSNTIGIYACKGIVPALLGKIVVGGLFVEALYWHLRLHGQDDIAVDGHRYESIARIPEDLEA
jgi:hypothetical protein